MSDRFGGCGVCEGGRWLMPPPPPYATTHLSTRPSANDTSGKLEGDWADRAFWGESPGTRPWRACPMRRPL